MDRDKGWSLEVGLMKERRGVVVEWREREERVTVVMAIDACTWRIK
jgi:hypothetical protein